MAKKTKTNLRQSKTQTKLLLLFAIIFAGIGIYLVSTSFAAKGGKGKPGSGTITYVDSPYAIKAEPSIVKYGSSVTITAVNKLTQDPLNPLPEYMNAKTICYVNGVSVTESTLLLQKDGSGQRSFLLSATALSGGASCTTYLLIPRNGSLVPTASTTFTVAP